MYFDPWKILTCFALSGMGKTWGLGAGTPSASDQSGFFTVLWGSLKNERFQSSNHEAESRDGQVYGPPQPFCCPVQMFSVDVEVTIQETAHPQRQLWDRTSFLHFKRGIIAPVGQLRHVR